MKIINGLILYPKWVNHRCLAQIQCTLYNPKQSYHPRRKKIQIHDITNWWESKCAEGHLVGGKSLGKSLFEGPTTGMLVLDNAGIKLISSVPVLLAIRHKPFRKPWWTGSQNNRKNGPGPYILKRTGSHFFRTGRHSQNSRKRNFKLSSNILFLLI